MLLSIFPFSVFASESVPSSIVKSSNLSQTKIEDDFKYVFAGSYNINEYFFNSFDKDIYFITAMESCSSGGNFELYLYLYNPSRKHIRKNVASNNLSVAVFTSLNDNTQNDYEKRDIVLVDTYGDSVENDSITDALILKYRLEFDSFYDASFVRYYRMSDLELLLEGDYNTTAFAVCKEFEFFNDSKNNVNVSIKDLTTLEMDAFHTFYRVDTFGVDCYTDIQSVYFPVPNDVLKTYGSIYGMNCVWSKSSTNLALVTDNRFVSDAFQKDWIDKNLTDLMDNQMLDFKYSIFFARSYPIVGLAYENYSFAYNVENKLNDYIAYDIGDAEGALSDRVAYKFSGSIIPKVCAPMNNSDFYPIGMVFTSDNVASFEEKTVLGEDIISYIDKYGWGVDVTDKMISDLENGLMDKETFYSLIDGPIFFNGLEINRTFTVEMADSELGVYKICSGWERFWNNGFYDKDTGAELSFSKFQQIDLTDLKNLSIEDFSKKYLIDEFHVSCDSGSCGSCFSCNTSKNEYKDCTWFLLRYDTTRYQTFDALIVDNEKGNDDVCNSYLFQSEVIRGFDTISVSFSKDGEGEEAIITVFPILRSPTNFASDAWSPSKKPVSFFDGSSDEFNEIIKWIIVILAIVTAVAFVILILYLLNYLRPILSGAFNSVKQTFKKMKERKTDKKK